MDEELMSTGEVAEDADVTEAEAREWANENDVPRVGNLFVWRESDRDSFFSYLDDRDDAEAEADEEEEDEEYEDDEDFEDDEDEDAA